VLTITPLQLYITGISQQNMTFWVYIDHLKGFGRGGSDFFSGVDGEAYY